jgi:hypothetical protein
MFNETVAATASFLPQAVMRRRLTQLASSDAPDQAE